MFLDSAPPPHSSIIPLDTMCTIRHFKMNEINRYGKRRYKASTLPKNANVNESCRLGEFRHICFRN